VPFNTSNITLTEDYRISAFGPVPYSTHQSITHQPRLHCVIFCSSSHSLSDLWRTQRVASNNSPRGLYRY